MKIQKIYSNFSGQREKELSDAQKQSFKGAYIPRGYITSRKLADSIYENSSGIGKFLMWLNKNNGENLNNAVTAIGTTGVAPFFIAFNPFSKEDKNSKAYTALRQPISAIITLGIQLFIMSNYNKWIDKHAAYLGVDEMDLAAKPPKSVVLPRAKSDYSAYYSECLKTGIEPEKKKKWIVNRVRELQDEAYYSVLGKMRANADSINIKFEDTVKLDLLNEKREECFKRILKDNLKFPEKELLNLDSFNDLIGKKGKKICKALSLEHATVRDLIDAEAMRLAVEDVKKSIEIEAKVKLQTSIYKSELLQELSQKLLDLKEKPTQKQLVSPSGVKTHADILQEKTAAVKRTLYQNLLDRLKGQYEQISAKNLESLSSEELISKLVYEKLLKYKEEPIDGLKSHGTNFEQVFKSVAIKKYLINRINKSEAKLAGWKNRSGMIVGLLILPKTCKLLNWAYPKVMKEYFPKLSEAKEASKAEEYGLDVVSNSKNQVKEAE